MYSLLPASRVAGGEQYPRVRESHASVSVQLQDAFSKCCQEFGIVLRFCHMLE
jgi:hypothetical protein